MRRSALSVDSSLDSKLGKGEIYVGCSKKGEKGGQGRGWAAVGEPRLPSSKSVPVSPSQSPSPSPSQSRSGGRTQASLGRSGDCTH